MKKTICITLCVLFFLSASGCWDRVESRDLALLNSIIYDTDGKGGYEVTVEISNPAAQSQDAGGSAGKPSITVSEKAESCSEALRKVSVILERTIFGGQNRVRFFSERLANKGVYGLFDYTSRDFIADERNFIVVIKGDEPKKIHEVKIGLSYLMGEHIENLFNNQRRMYSQAAFTSSLQFLQDMLSDGKQPVAGVVEIVPCEDSSSVESENEDINQDLKLIYKGLAAFKGDKLVGYMDGIEARAYNFLINDAKTAYLSIEEEGYQIAAVVKNALCKVTATPKNNNFVFDVVMDFVIGITTVDGNIDIMDMEIDKFIEKKFNEEMHSQIYKTLEKAQKEFNSDIFGFGGYIHIQHPKLWKEIKKDWHDNFKDAKINVNVNTQIKFTGQIDRSVTEESE